MSLSEMTTELRDLRAEVAALRARLDAREAKRAKDTLYEWPSREEVAARVEAALPPELRARG